MNATLTPARTRFEPTAVAAETFLIHDHHGEGQAHHLGIWAGIFSASDTIPAQIDY
jgi:hypothetical protein